jgi:hypothetical protein
VAVIYRRMGGPYLWIQIVVLSLLFVEGYGAKRLRYAIAASIAVSCIPDRSSVGGVGEVLLVFLGAVALLSILSAVGRGIGITGRTVDGPVALFLLSVELVLPLLPFARFASNWASVIRTIAADNWLWRPTLLRLLKSAQLIVVDATMLERGSGLDWEIAQCLDRDKRLLLVIREEHYSNVLGRLRELDPELVLLPEDVGRGLVRAWDEYERTGKRLESWLWVYPSDDSRGDRFHMWLQLALDRDAFVDWTRIQVSRESATSG